MAGYVDSRSSPFSLLSASRAGPHISWLDASRYNSSLVTGSVGTIGIPKWFVPWDIELIISTSVQRQVLFLFPVPG